MGVPFPENYGGAGLDTPLVRARREELARSDSSVAITLAAHMSLGTMPIYLFGTEEQRRGAAPGSGLRRRLAAFGLTEPGRAPTRARPARAQSSVTGAGVNGPKTSSRTPNRHQRLRDDHRRHRRAGRTPGDLEPDSAERHTRLRSLGTDAQARLARLGYPRALVPDCPVPADHLLGERGDGFSQFLEILDGGRISVAALGVGLAQGAYELALAHAKARAVRRRISRFQAMQFKLADMATEIEALERCLPGGEALAGTRGRRSSARPRWRSVLRRAPTGS